MQDESHNTQNFLPYQVEIKKMKPNGWKDNQNDRHALDKLINMNKSDERKNYILSAKSSAPTQSMSFLAQNNDEQTPCNSNIQISIPFLLKQNSQKKDSSQKANKGLSTSLENEIDLVGWQTFGNSSLYSKMCQQKDHNRDGQLSSIPQSESIFNNSYQFNKDIMNSFIPIEQSSQYRGERTLPRFMNNKQNLKINYRKLSSVEENKSSDRSHMKLKKSNQISTKEISSKYPSGKDLKVKQIELLQNGSYAISNLIEEMQQFKQNSFRQHNLSERSHNNLSQSCEQPQDHKPLSEHPYQPSEIFYQNKQMQDLNIKAEISQKHTELEPQDSQDNTNSQCSIISSRYKAKNSKKESSLLNFLNFTSRARSRQFPRQKQSLDLQNSQIQNMPMMLMQRVSISQDFESSQNAREMKNEPSNKEQIDHLNKIDKQMRQSQLFQDKMSPSNPNSLSKQFLTIIGYQKKLRRPSSLNYNPNKVSKQKITLAQTDCHDEETQANQFYKPLKVNYPCSISQHEQRRQSSQEKNSFSKIPFISLKFSCPSECKVKSQADRPKTTKTFTCKIEVEKFERNRKLLSDSMQSIDNKKYSSSEKHSLESRKSPSPIQGYADKLKQKLLFKDSTSSNNNEQNKSVCQQEQKSMSFYPRVFNNCSHLEAKNIQVRPQNNQSKGTSGREQLQQKQQQYSIAQNDQLIGGKNSRKNSYISYQQQNSAQFNDDLIEENLLFQNDPFLIKKVHIFQRNQPQIYKFQNIG